MVPEDEVGPGFAYTIGLAHSFGAPELAMFGLDIRVFHWQEDSEDRHRQSRPCLWIPPGEHPQGVWTAGL